VQSVDHAGVFTRTVQDAAIVLNEIPSSPFNVKCKPGFDTSVTNKKSIVGVVQNFKASDEVNSIFKSAVAIFQSLGCKIEHAEMPMIPSSVNFGESEIEAYHTPLIKQFKEAYDPVTIKD
jgi:Asp-tRNA(Asn)/Glu-tRNA(Gln) amidotransferase A subunit family amidase